MKIEVLAPLTGQLISIDGVNDPVFSQRMMGDGFAIIPEETSVYAPFDATIEVLFPTGHAIGLKSANGLEMLIHIGIDTVNSKSGSFKAAIKQGQQVKKGDLLVEFNEKKLKAVGYDLVTVCIFLSGQKLSPVKTGHVIHSTPLSLETQ